MPNVFGLQTNDASISPAVFALPAAAGSTQSAAIDLGTDLFKIGQMEFSIAIPALGVGIIPNAITLTAILETSTVSNFASIVATQSAVAATGAGGVGVSATETLFRVPSNCPRYVRFKVTTGATSGDASAVSATGKVLL